MQVAKKLPEDRSVWEKRYKEFQASEKSQAQWCKEKKINPNTFNFWYLRLKREKAEPVEQPNKSIKWLAVDPKEIEIKTETNIVPTNSTIELKIADVSIAVKPGFEPEHLIKIIKALSKLC